MTHGLQIIEQSLSVATAGGGKGYAHGNQWQYHSRSDRHSKIVCWAVVFDLMVRNNLLSRHVREEHVTFGINHTMRDYVNGRKKDLDLVICRRGEPRGVGRISNFRDMVEAYTIVLTERQQALLDGLPEIPLTGVQTALVALEAKAAMTEFGKARPRLYDELNSSHQTIHGDTASSIAAGLALINLSDRFVSPIRNDWTLDEAHPPEYSAHVQPSAAAGVIDKVAQLPRRSGTDQRGFDALTIILIDCANDGSPVRVVRGPPAPQPGDAFAYDSFIERIETIYANRWTNGI